MNTYTRHFFISILFLGNNLLSQNRSVIKLGEVILSNFSLKNFSKGYRTKIISDSIIARNNTSLTDILRFNSFIYFKEYGNGMISSPSFRGTGASQTAVVWNGININSQLNGQTDFNTVSINSLDNIAVRNGGGSVLFGSGAIGGSVHLNNNILFRKHKSHKLQLSYGSFQTLNTYYKTTYATARSYANITVELNSSDNNYRFLGTTINNNNGEFYNWSFSGNLGYKINRKNQLKFYTNTFFADRNISRTLTAPSKSKYKNVTSRNLLKWDYFLNSKELITSRFAYLYEQSTYFEDNTKLDLHSVGESNRRIININYKNNLSDKINLNAIIGYEGANGKGDNLHNKSRNVFSSVALFNHRITNYLTYQIQFRKEFIERYSPPLVYSFGLEIEANKIYTVSLNTSKNFRVPTFNDLYWKRGGNMDLNPETSYQIELGNNFSFKNLTIKLNSFYIKSNDLIQWRPDKKGLWTPLNVSKADNYGGELSVELYKKINNHFFNFSSNYSFTIAKDKDTDKILIYVPKHRANFWLNYKYKGFSAYYQQLINGKVFVIADALPAYTVSNLGINYQFNSVSYHPKIGIKIGNLFNYNYQNLQNRPMPNRNIKLKINLNF